MPVRFDLLAWLSAVVLAVVLVAGCSVREPYYCPGRNPNNNCLDPGDGPRQCTASGDGACTGTTPVCGDDHSCRPCVAHAECASRACLPDGACGDDSSVAYVDPDGTDNPLCTGAAPCTRVSRALATGRPYVKLVGRIDEAVTVDSGRVVTFLGGPGARLTRTSVGPIVTVRDNGTSLGIYDLSISDALGADGIGIQIPSGAGSASVTLVRVTLRNNGAGGISAEGGGSLTVTRSVISGNTAGGISVTDGTFTVVGNVFYSNGTQVSSRGGIHISTQRVGNRLEFNSFHKNAAKDDVGPAIHCVYGPIAASNNIMSDNGTVTNLNQVGGNCTHAYSIVRPGMLPPGPRNSSADPLFVNPALGDLHISASSPALRAADPDANLTGLAEHDLDGDVRTSPADIGADEVP